MSQRPLRFELSRFGLPDCDVEAVALSGMSTDANPKSTAPEVTAGCIRTSFVIQTEHGRDYRIFLGLF